MPVISVLGSRDRKIHGVCWPIQISKSLTVSENKVTLHMAILYTIVSLSIVLDVIETKVEVAL